MAFPQSVLGIKVELYYDGQWNRITPAGDVRGLGAEDGEIKIGNRGQPDESTSIRATIADLSINNKNGKYSPRNIRSSLYGKIGQNTKIRISADLTTDLRNVTDSFNDNGTNGWPISDSGHTYTASGGVIGNYLVNAGEAIHRHTTLNVLRTCIVDSVFVTDFDCIVEGINPQATITGGNAFVSLRGRVSQAVDDYVEGLIQFGPTFVVGHLFSVVDSIVTESTSSSTLPGFDGSETVSMRFQAFGRKIRIKVWETGTTQPTTWLLTLSVSHLVPGNIHLSSVLDSSVTNALPFDIAYNSIDFSLGMILYVGEIAEWPKKWDSTGNDVWTPIRPAGFTRRKIQGNKPIGSALSRALSRLDLIGYWSFENLRADISGAYQSMPSTYPGVGALARIGADFGTDYGTPKVTWNGDKNLSGSDSLPVVSSSVTNSESLVYKHGTMIPIFDTATNSYSVVVWVNSKIAQDQTTEQTLATWKIYVTNSQIASVGLQAGYQVNGSGVSVLNISGFAFDATETLISFFSATEFPLVEGWHAIKLTMTSPSVNTAGWRLDIDNLQTNTGTFAITSNNVGYPYGEAEFAVLSTDTSLSIAFGHFVIAAGITTDPIASNWSYILQAATGHNGEMAVTRIQRLCDEESVTVEITTDSKDTGTPLGPQKSLNFVKILEEIALAEGGLLGELRHDFGYGYTTRRALISLAQTSRFTLNYANADLAEVPESTDDDQRTMNEFTSNLKYNRDDVTVDVTATRTTGPLSVNEPDANPPGAGLYDDGDDVNLFTFSQLRDFSSWRVHLGTWDETRYPSITVFLHRSQFAGTLSKFVSAAFAEASDVFTITNLPVWLTPGDLNSQVRAARMHLSNFEWEIEWTTLPAGPWKSVATVGNDKAETTGSHIIVTVDDNDTELIVYTDEVFEDTQKTQLWTESAASLPIDFRVDAASRAGGRGGERVRAQSGAVRITPYAWDGFNRTVANGWGVPDLGGTYTTYGSGGVLAASDYNVAPTAGTIKLAAAGNVRGIYLDDVDLQDVRFGFTWQCPVPTGDPLDANIILRGGTAAEVQVKLSALQFAAHQLVLEIWDATRLIQIDSFGSLNFLDYTTSIPIRMIASIEDTVIQVAVWAPGSATEPLFWTWVTEYDSVAPDSGWVGVEVQSGAFNTNVNPTFSISDLSLDNPQKIAVTRGIDGVSRDWPAGSDVRLWDTPILGR